MPQSSDWNAPWLNRTNWILDHLETFSLEPAEILVVLVLNFLNETGQTITPEMVVAKTALDLGEVEAAFDSLTNKGYLVIGMLNNKVSFRLDGLYSNASPMQERPLQQTLIREFGNEFGRPLSGSEMERITRLGQDYEEDMILHALDEAAAYNKRSLNYVEALLDSWRSRGLDAADIENGRR